MPRRVFTPPSIPMRLCWMLLLLLLLLFAAAGCSSVSAPTAPVSAPQASAPPPVFSGDPLPPPVIVVPEPAIVVPEPVSLAPATEVATAPEPARPAALPPSPDVEAGEIGSATYYANRFAGRRTASGAIYDPEKFTAAHTDLPFGTRVRVVNLANGQEVTVTVNDRCRPRKTPFIDLSRAAARAIGFFGKGKTRVRIIPLTEGDETVPSGAERISPVNHPQ